MVIKKVTIVGTGVMGHPMADHLLDAGFDLTIYARRPETCQDLKEKGALLVNSLWEAARGAQVVITMLPTQDTVREVVLGKDGLADGAQPGTIFVNSSTVSPESNILLGEELARRGMKFVDSPVTGSGLQARDKTLVFIVGGEKEVYESLLPLYKAMGANAYHASETIGAGSYAKVCSNAMMAINMLSFSEALAMAKKAGVDPEMFVKFCHGGGPQSAMADKKIGKILNRDFSPAFRTALMYKDTGLASDLSKELDIPSPLLNLGKEIYKIACLRGLGDEDMCSVVKCYEEWGGITIEK